MAYRTLAVMRLAVIGLVGCTGPTGPAGPQGPAGPAGPNFILGFAAVDATVDPPVVVNSGGDVTTSVSAIRLGTGHYDVTFIGDFAHVTSTGEVTALVTMLDTDLHVATAPGDELRVSVSTITVGVWVWRLSPLLLDGASFALLLLR